MRGTIWMVAIALCASACGGGEVVDAGRDATAGADVGLDAGMRDAGRDGSIADAGRDAAIADAGRDASIEDAGGDASIEDAGTDAGSDAGADGGSDAGADGGPIGTPVAFECVPAVAGNESASGMLLDAMFWTGFRFEVGAGPDVSATSLEVNLQSSSAGTIFGALVRLSGPSDAPDSPDLTSGDVIAMTTIPLPGGGTTSITAAGPISATLAPGWYAAVFGTGAFGATLSSATVHSNSGGGGCGSGFGFPFTIRQSDGMLILQGATPHFAVRGLRP